jgi:general secretion pathway protein B
MSSILKALKKLEDEKAAHLPDTLKIDSDILRGANSRCHSTTVLVLAALLLFTGGSIATYLYMKKDSSPVVEAAKKPMNVPNKSVQPTLPVPVATEIKTEELPKAVEIVPAQNSKITRVVTPKRKKHIVSVKSAPDITPQLHDQPKHDQQKDIPIVTPVQSPAPPRTVPLLTVPLLRVNGIAHQGGSADSVAVINGVPVSDGAMIEGVKVEAIQKNRVRFSYKGETFEIPLGQSNR